MDKAKKAVYIRKRKVLRIKKKMFGQYGMLPRLCIRRTLKHIYAQIVDDKTGMSIVQVGSNSKEVFSFLGANSSNQSKKMQLSKIIGKLIAQRAKEKDIEKVVFDRRGYPYHGRVKVLADSARNEGLVF
jgi:large subunit ribosomal protein L18